MWRIGLLLVIVAINSIAVFQALDHSPALALQAPMSDEARMQKAIDMEVARSRHILGCIGGNKAAAYWLSNHMMPNAIFGEGAPVMRRADLMAKCLDPNWMKFTYLDLCMFNIDVSGEHVRLVIRYTPDPGRPTAPLFQRVVDWWVPDQKEPMVFTDQSFKTEATDRCPTDGNHFHILLQKNQG